MRSYYVIYLFIILLYIGCDSKPVHVIKTEYYPNGHIRYRITYINDTLRDGKAISYDENGNLDEIAYYFKGESDSVIIKYYPDGGIKTYIDLYGPYQISVDEYYRNGSVKKYVARNPNHGFFYKIEYDSICGKIFEQGQVISGKMVFDTIKPWHVGDSIGLSLFIAHPPDYNSNVFIGAYRVNNIVDTAVFYSTPGKEIVQPFKKYEINRMFVNYSLLFKEKGTYQSIFAGELIDTKTGFHKRDTISRVWQVE